MIERVDFIRIYEYSPVEVSVHRDETRSTFDRNVYTALVGDCDRLGCVVCGETADVVEAIDLAPMVPGSDVASVALCGVHASSKPAGPAYDVREVCVAEDEYVRFGTWVRDVCGSSRIESYFLGTEREKLTGFAPRVDMCHRGHADGRGTAVVDCPGITFPLYVGINTDPAEWDGRVPVLEYVPSALELHILQAVQS